MVLSSSGNNSAEFSVKILRYSIDVLIYAAPPNKHLVDVGPFSLHRVVFPFARVLISVGVRHLAHNRFLAVPVVAFVYCVHLIELLVAPTFSLVRSQAHFLWAVVDRAADESLPTASQDHTSDKYIITADVIHTEHATSGLTNTTSTQHVANRCHIVRI